MAEQKEAIGGLWKSETRNGREMIKGTITIKGEKIKIVVWPNTYKQHGESTPDYRIYIDDYVPRRGGEQPDAAGQTTAAPTAREMADRFESRRRSGDGYIPPGGQAEATEETEAEPSGTDDEVPF